MVYAAVSPHIFGYSCSCPLQSRGVHRELMKAYEVYGASIGAPQTSSSVLRDVLGVPRRVSQGCHPRKCSQGSFRVVPRKGFRMPQEGTSGISRR